MSTSPSRPTTRARSLHPGSKTPTLSQAILSQLFVPLDGRYAGSGRAATTDAAAKTTTLSTVESATISRAQNLIDDYGGPVGHSDVTSADARAARGKAARAAVPFSAHASWERPDGRSSPIDLLEAQAEIRLPQLIPIRHGRMLVSEFTYYRGAALAMAADLATTPNSGLTVQLCGDAHLCNFGVFGSPERHLVFDVNDFDETAPGPWEWDVKRLAASLEVASRDSGFKKKERVSIVCNAVRSYRETIRLFSGMSMLEVWYSHLDLDRLLPQFQSLLDPTRTPGVWRAVSRARAHDTMHAFEKLCRLFEGEPRFISDPPLVMPIEELGTQVDNDELLAASTETILRDYAASLEPDRRHLMEQYRLVHLARKVVGVGSVGTDCWIALLVERDGRAPLLLQLKEAQRAVLEDYAGDSAFVNHGQRVVAGQRLMQSASDIFLGWVGFDWPRRGRRDYYVRQLTDWKGSADVRGMTPAGMELWGRMCGWILARAHARSGDRIAVASYLGKSDGFDRAIGDFAVAYADQNARDHQLLQDAVRTGRLEATTDL